MAPGPPDKYSNNKFYPLGDYINNPKKKTETKRISRFTNT